MVEVTMGDARLVARRGLVMALMARALDHHRHTAGAPAPAGCKWAIWAFIFSCTCRAAGEKLPTTPRQLGDAHHPMGGQIADMGAADNGRPDDVSQ